MTADDDVSLPRADVPGDDKEQRDTVTLPAGPDKGLSDEVMHCYICARMRKTRPQKHTSLVSGSKIRTCLLCCRDFCDKHNGDDKDVCEIKHDTYYRNHRHLQDVYPSMAVRASFLRASGRGD